MSRFLWTQKEDIGPSARFGHAMTYDSVRSRTTLFGGLIGGQIGSVNDTWEWNGEFWTQMADIGPAARQDHGLCFDSVRQTALLFGGLSGGSLLGSAVGASFWPHFKWKDSTKLRYRQTHEFEGGPELPPGNFIVGSF